MKTFLSINFSIFTILLTNYANAQTFAVTGKVQDEKQQPLQYASVSLLRLADSSNV
ncbi:MAG: hypothetical protein H7325_06770, partial [Pedobacter sp.]|nr:hypothetical protein [Pedobacter sp.]